MSCSRFAASANGGRILSRIVGDRSCPLEIGRFVQVAQEVGVVYGDGEDEVGVRVDYGAASMVTFDGE